MMTLPWQTAITLLSVAALAATATAQDGHDERVVREHRGDAPVANRASETAPATPVAAQDVAYATIDGAPVRGYLARPEKGAEHLPGLIVIHEWWGLNDNVRAMTRRLAGEGYTALAVDLYGGIAAVDPTLARELMQKSLGRREANDDNLRQAYAYLSGRWKAPKIGAIGWSFGGGYALQTALLLPTELDACVIYYGHVEPAEPKLVTVDAPILGIFGAEDRDIPVERVKAFERALTELGKNAEIHIYEGAGHAFANPSGTRYQPEAAAEAWTKTTAFLAAHLK
jgi:carboxymethylenebutenolidase